MSRPVIYRLDIEYPEGCDKPGWYPEDYDPDSYDAYWGYQEPFRWPRERLFLSRSGAGKRAGQLEAWGARVTVVPSLPVEWPAEPGCVS